MRVCTFCGTILDRDIKIGRSSVCPNCQKDLKICLNCIFYSKDAHWNCRESISELVRDKDKSNFCDYFKLKESQGSKMPPDKQNQAKEDFFKLFGNE